MAFHLPVSPQASQQHRKGGHSDSGHLLMRGNGQVWSLPFLFLTSPRVSEQQGKGGHHVWPFLHKRYWPGMEQHPIPTPVACHLTGLVGREVLQYPLKACALGNHLVRLYGYARPGHGGVLGFLGGVGQILGKIFIFKQKKSFKIMHV